MKTEQKVFNDLIKTIVRNSENNIATITDVKLWAKTWQTEMEQELTLTDVSQQRELLKAYTKWLNDKIRDENELDELIGDYFDSL